MSESQTGIQDKAVAAIFQPDPAKPPRALLVAGACGNVGFGKLGQFARILSKHGVPVIALDLSPAVHETGARLHKAMGKRFACACAVKETASGEKEVVIQGDVM